MVSPSLLKIYVYPWLRPHICSIHRQNAQGNHPRHRSPLKFTSDIRANLLFCADIIPVRLLLTLLDCRCGGGGGGQLRCGGGAGGFRGPPFRIIGLTLSRSNDLGLALAEDGLDEGAGVGGSGGDGAPLDIPAPPRNWSRRAATLLLLLDDDGGWVIGGEGAWELMAELWIRAVFTALNIVDPPILFRLVLEKLRAGVGGGGGFTDGRAVNVCWTIRTSVS